MSSSQGHDRLLWEILCSSNQVTVSVYIVRVFSSIEHQVFFIRTSRCNTDEGRSWVGAPEGTSAEMAVEG